MACITSEFRTKAYLRVNSRAATASWKTRSGTQPSINRSGSSTKIKTRFSKQSSWVLTLSSVHSSRRATRVTSSRSCNLYKRQHSILNRTGNKLTGSFQPRKRHPESKDTITVAIQPSWVKNLARVIKYRKMLLPLN